MTDKPQLLCGKTALKIFYWPGHDPMPICPDHLAWMEQVSGAIGLYVRTEKAERGATCTQKVEKDALAAQEGP